MGEMTSEPWNARILGSVGGTQGCDDVSDLLQ